MQTKLLLQYAQRSPNQFSFKPPSGKTPCTQTPTPWVITSSAKWKRAPMTHIRKGPHDTIAAQCLLMMHWIITQCISLYSVRCAVFRAVQYSAVQCSIVQGSVVQCSAVQCRAVQCAVQCSAAIQVVESEPLQRRQVACCREPLAALYTALHCTLHCTALHTGWVDPYKT